MNYQGFDRPLREQHNGNSSEEENTPVSVE